MLMVMTAQVVEVINETLGLQILLVFIPRQPQTKGLATDGENLKASHYVFLQAFLA
jgi:hypothetical protein